MKAVELNFQKRYKEKAVPAMTEKLGRKNIMSLPRVSHIVVASGVGKHAKEGKFLEDVENGLRALSGQNPVRTLSKKSIAGFKLREGQVAGLMVSLRGRRMEEFLEKLIHVVLPRVRDFRGIPVKNIDQNGNLSFGVREAQSFPEVDPQKIETIFGLQVTIVTTAKKKEEAKILLETIGFPLTEAEVEEARAQGPQKKAKK